MGKRIIQISDDLILFTFREGNVIQRSRIAAGLPEDARILDARHVVGSSLSSHVELIVESDQWPSSEDGKIALHDIMVETIYDFRIAELPNWEPDILIDLPHKRTRDD